ncbi:MAG: long-chain fatty acid--CoA ligase [Chthoniobacterales bacterium]|nr:long-chain fatty acid--CoA ligase [Chthoniobacterales bacterium]
MASPQTTDRHIYDRAKNIADLYRLAGEVYAQQPAVATRAAGGDFKARTYRELYDQACALGTAFIELGLQARQQVALISDNRAEWMLCDCAVLLCGGADVPRAADVTVQDISYIVAHSDSVLVIAEDKKVLQRILEAQVSLPKVRHIILIEGEPPEGSGVLRLADLLERGRHLRAAGDRVIEERIAQIKGDDIFTLIYTSGTTGTPKGVMLTHDNMLSQVRYLPFDLTPQDRILSILPVWHSYERVFEMVTISRGACTYYTGLRTVGEDLRKVRPTWMASAPRLWEGLYQRILNNVSDQPLLRRALFHAAYHCSREFQTARFFLTGRKLDLEGRTWIQSMVGAVGSLAAMAVYAIPHAVLDALVLKKLRGVVGGNFCGTVSGGGALPPHVDEFFNYIGIPVLEGYGMTETSPVLAVRTWRKLIIGTVGPAWPHTEIRIVETGTGKVLYPAKFSRGGGRGLKGEIHARGPQVMKGYYKDPEATGRVLKDEWMNTGDIGMVTFNDCLKILGRSKETIVLLNGENVEPVPIEAQMLESRFIEQCMVVGQDEKQLGALVVPALAELKVQGFDFTSLEEAAADERVSELVGGEIRRMVSREQGFKAFEFVQVWRLVGKPFEVGDELTATFKPKRHVITEKYQAHIDSMFQHTRTSRKM